MILNEKRYVNLYNVNLTLVVDKKIIKVSPSDIISLSIINNYDSMTYPIIRFRLYTDINIIQSLAENPSDIFVRCNLDGGVYMLKEQTTPSIVQPTKSISFSMKGYIENKNIASNSYEEYVNGIKKTSDLNDNIKVPIELYCYHEETITKFHQYAQSIYKDTTIETVINDLFNRCGIHEFEIDKIHNQEKYEQILFPNLNIIKSLSLIDNDYGIYPKGAQMYCDFDNVVRIVDMDVNTNKTTIPIYVTSGSNQTDTHGLKKINDKFYFSTSAECVSVVSETDIERSLNTENVTSINAQTLEISTHKLTKLYDSTEDPYKNESLGSAYVHKLKNKYIADTIAARINEHITNVDISLTGVDISKLTVDSRINIVFETPIRGMNINNRYRQINNVHVLNQLDSNLFYAQTNLRISSN